MKNKNIYSKLCKVIWLLMLVIIVLSVIHGGMLYKYCQIYPQKEYTTDRSSPELPEEALTKISMINTLRLILGMGVLLIVMYFFCDYKADKEKSYFAGIVASLKKIKLEND